MAGLTLAMVAGLIGLLAWASAGGRAARLRVRAEAEADAGNWPAALADWRGVNASSLADASSFLGEARAALALGRAGQAEHALRAAAALDPGEPTALRLRLELLRVEDRGIEAEALVWGVFDRLPRASRRVILKGLTLALLSSPPDDLARRTLGRWVEADPGDDDARVALLRRVAADPRPGDPDQAARIAALEAILRRDPSHARARATLVEALADAGEPKAGRAVLDAWPEARRDADFQRLRARWTIEYDPDPAASLEAAGKALEFTPHDWRVYYLRARALNAAGGEADAREAAEEVARLRESLEPAALGRRLDADFARPEDPRTRLDLADLCARVGLRRLADAWRQDAERPDEPPHLPLDPRLAPRP